MDGWMIVTTFKSWEKMGWWREEGIWNLVTCWKLRAGHGGVLILKPDTFFFPKFSYNFIF